MKAQKEHLKTPSNRFTEVCRRLGSRILHQPEPLAERIQLLREGANHPGARVTTEVTRDSEYGGLIATIKYDDNSISTIVLTHEGGIYGYHTQLSTENTTRELGRDDIQRTLKLIEESHREPTTPPQW